MESSATNPLVPGNIRPQTQDAFATNANPRHDVRTSCANHAPKPIGAQPGDVRVGNCVKRMFLSSSGGEHMWVHVTCIDHKDFVHGHLHSYPVYGDYDPPLEWGAEAVVAYEQIEGIERCEAAA